MPSKSKKSLVKKSKAKPKAPNLFRQILAERKRDKEESPPQPYRSDHRSSYPQHRHEQFAKFAGPRRRAA